MADVRLIDANKLKRIIYNIANTMQDNGYSSYAGALGEAANIVDNQQTIDAVPVVRCRECRNAQQLKTSADQVYCMVWGKNPRIDGYCYLGAKMDGGAADGSE